MRKACVDIVVEIAKICEMRDREETLSTILLGFLIDMSKWVKIAAYKALGPFIACLEGS